MPKKKNKLGPENKIVFESLEMPFLQRALEMYVENVEAAPDGAFGLMTKDFALHYAKSAKAKVDSFFDE